MIYNGYNKLHDVFERYAIYDFDQKLIDFLLGECVNFLYAKKIDRSLMKNFVIQFKISTDYSLVEVNGGNLMSSLWLINVFPSNPEKYIFDKIYKFDGKNYIYNPQNKSLKVRKYAERSRSKGKNK